MGSFNNPPKSLIVFSILVLFIIIGNGYNALSDRYNFRDIKHYYLIDYKGELKRIEKKYDINITYDVASKPNLIPEVYRKSPYNIKFTQISDFGLCRYAYLLPVILDLYPQTVISNSLNGIVLLGSLSVYDIDYSGTYIDKKIYLTNNGKDQGYSDDYLKLLFHHEISSVLLYKFKFDFKKWMALNPKEFSYMQTEEEVLASIQKGADDNYNDPNLLKQGFLNSYAQSNFENDFNLYAEVIFTFPEKMCQLINQYPRVKQKYLFVKSFYINIDPQFSPVFDRIL